MKKEKDDKVARKKKGKSKKISKTKILKKRYDEWANAVKDRDGWVCQMCGMENHAEKPNGKKVVLNAHHVVPRDYKNIPSLRFDVENGITLCASCHKWNIHGPHHSGIVFSEWFRRKYPERYCYLVEKVFDGDGVDLKIECEEEIENGEKN